MEKENKTIIETALERFKYCEDAERGNRDAALDDLKFSMGEQWPEDIRNARENNIEGAQPCLTLDKIDQYVRQVVNDSRQNKPSIKIRPKDSGADPETAEVLQGLTRQIEDQSSADVAYDTAVEMAARAAFGFIRVVTDYADDEGFLQDIFIRPVLNPFSCYIDPDYTKPDFSDLGYGFAWEDMPIEQFKAQYPKADCAPFETGESSSDWLKEKTIRVCEYFERVTEDKTIWQAEDGSASEMEIPGAISRTIKRSKVMWRKITAKEVLEESEWPSKYIPIIPVYGHLIDVDGKRVYKSLHRAAQDAQRLYNYAASAFVERVALTPKAPYILSINQVEGHEDAWKKANNSNQAYLPYNADPGAPPPMRQQAADIPAGWSMVMQGMEHDIQAALGMYSASIGAPSNEKSGRAIMARQREADNATFHIIDNLSRAIRQVGRIVVDLIPKIYDTDRIVRILGEDGKEEFARVSPDIDEAKKEIHDLQGNVIERIYNPSVGRYDVTVSVGPSYGTKRQEAADFLTQVVQSSPQMMSIVGDLMFKSLDMPYAEEVSERLAKMLPPPLQEQQGASPDVQKAQAMIQQLQKQLAQATAAANEKRGDMLARTAELKIKNRELNIKEYDAETKRLQVTAAAMTPEQVQEMVLRTLEDLRTVQDGGMQPQPQPMMQQQPEIGEMPESPAVEQQEQAAPMQFDVNVPMVGQEQEQF